MPAKFQNKYRIASARLQNWDYRWSAAYFITICTHNRKHFFGEIENGEMYLSPQGILADRLKFLFEGQSRFYNNIIRDAEAYRRIKNYIIANPKNWKEDRFF